MANFEWKIKELTSIDDQIDSLKYYVKATEGDFVVETEGYADLKLPPEVIFKDLTEVELIEYLKRFYIQENVNTIESNLSKQLANLAKVRTNLPPWHVETFKVEV